MEKWVFWLKVRFCRVIDITCYVFWWHVSEHQYKCPQQSWWWWSGCPRQGRHRPGRGFAWERNGEVWDSAAFEVEHQQLKTAQATGMSWTWVENWTVEKTSASGFYRSPSSSELSQDMLLLLKLTSSKEKRFKTLPFSLAHSRISFRSTNPEMSDRN